MKKLLLFISICALVLPASGQVMWQFNKDTVVTWQFEFGDEFNSSKVDTGKWDYWYGWARSIYGNKEQQYYSEGKNHTIENGELKLIARKEGVNERMVDWLPDTDTIKNGDKFYSLNKSHFTYTAGMIQSKQDLLYGYFEIKFNMSPVKGYWPAFWLWGGTPNEEIDFCELKTEKKNKIHVGRHSQNENENYLPYFLFKKKVWGDWVKFKGDLTENYNVISGEWDKDYIKYYLNGECIAFTKVSLGVPKRLVANIAVPGNGPFKPGPSANDTGQAEFKIDYIHVWTRNPVVKNKTVQEVFADNIDVKRELGRSSLKSKTKFLYGKKEMHKNEGITVSLVPLSNDKYKLTVLGKSIPADAGYTIYSGDGKIMTSSKLNYGESIFDLAEFKSKEFKFVIEAFGKKAMYDFFPSSR
jgi:beta-glucanase (GH16 family)